MDFDEFYRIGSIPKTPSEDEEDSHSETEEKQSIRESKDRELQGLMTYEDLRELMHHILYTRYYRSDDETDLVGFVEMCSRLVRFDYQYDILENKDGRVCPDYPGKIIIPLEEAADVEAAVPVDPAAAAAPVGPAAAAAAAAPAGPAAAAAAAAAPAGPAAAAAPAGPAAAAAPVGPAAAVPVAAAVPADLTPPGSPAAAAVPVPAAAVPVPAAAVPVPAAAVPVPAAAVPVPAAAVPVPAAAVPVPAAAVPVPAAAVPVPAAAVPVPAAAVPVPVDLTPPGSPAAAAVPVPAVAVPVPALDPNPPESPPVDPNPPESPPVDPNPPESPPVDPNPPESPPVDPNPPESPPVDPNPPESPPVDPNPPQDPPVERNPPESPMSSGSDTIILGEIDVQEDVAQLGDVPQGDVPQGDVPQGDVPQGDVPQGDVPQGDVPQGDVPQGDVQQGDVQQGDVQQGDVQQGDVQQGDVQQGDVQQGDVQQGDVQQGDVQQGDVQQGDVQQGDVQQGDVQQGDVQQGDVQQGDVQQGDVQQGDVPEREPSPERPIPRFPDEEIVTRLSGIILKSRRVRRGLRFPVPVIFFEGKYVCRSAAVHEQVASEWKDNIRVDRDFIFRDFRYGMNTSTALYLLLTVGFTKAVRTDVDALRCCDIGYIADLRVECTAKRFSNVVNSAEDYYSWYYREFETAFLPYPEIPFFVAFHENRNVEELIYNWPRKRPTIDLQLPVDLKPQGIDYNKYKEIYQLLHQSRSFQIFFPLLKLLHEIGDLVLSLTKWKVLRLTQNYLLLLLNYVTLGKNGVLVHCLDGHDRTSLFISLLRLSLWADGLIHKKLKVVDIIYLTVAYDWYLFGHDFPQRLQFHLEIMRFCFSCVPYIVSDEFSRAPLPSCGTSVSKREEKLIAVWKVFLKFYNEAYEMVDEREKRRQRLKRRAQPEDS